MVTPLAGVPGAAAAVFVFGLALTARDGLLALLGLAVTGAAVWLSVYLWATIAPATAPRGGAAKRATVANAR